MKQAEKMTRWELMQELRSYVHPVAYQSAINNVTEVLAALIAYYRVGRLIR